MRPNFTPVGRRLQEGARETVKAAAENGFFRFSISIFGRTQAYLLRLLASAAILVLLLEVCSVSNAEGART